MKYIVGITEIEFYNSKDEILPPELRPFSTSIKLQKIKTDRLEKRYAIGVSKCTGSNNLKAITLYLRVLKSFDTTEEAEAYQGELVKKIEAFEALANFAEIRKILNEELGKNIY